MYSLRRNVQSRLIAECPLQRLKTGLKEGRQQSSFEASNILGSSETALIYREAIKPRAYSVRRATMMDAYCSSSPYDLLRQRETQRKYNEPKHLGSAA